MVNYDVFELQRITDQIGILPTLKLNIASHEALDGSLVSFYRMQRDLRH